MKPTVTVNIGGIAFHIDDDAYSLLSGYLQDIENHLHESDSKKEIMQDIEARIAELFKQHLNFSHLEVVNLVMVQDVIKQLGRPEVISDGMSEEEMPEEEQNNEKTEDAAEQASEQPHYRKHFYRDVDQQNIGGVCAGIGKLLGIDAIWIRIIFILLFLLNGVGMLLYLVLWIIVPPANTAARRLEMEGIEPSAENIRNEVEQQRLRNEANPYKPGRSSGNAVVYGCFIALLILFGLPIVLVLIAVLIALVCAALGVGAASIPLVGVAFADGLVNAGLVTIGCTLASILLPIIALSVWATRRNKGKEQPKAAFWIFMLILWIIAVVGMLTFGVYTSVRLENIDEEQVSQNIIQYLDSTGILPIDSASVDFYEQQLDSLDELDDVIEDRIERASEGVLEITDEDVTQI